MDADTARLLQKAGVDLADAHSRFSGDEDLFTTLIGLYLEDTHFAQLARALDEGNVQEAFKSAHALKGAAGNLSLARLHDLASATCDHLREGNLTAARESMPELESAHLSAIEAIGALKR